MTDYIMYWGETHMVQKYEKFSFKITLLRKIISEHSQHPAHRKADGKTDGQGNLRVKKQTVVSTWALPGLTFWGKHFCLTYLKRGFVGKRKFQGTKEQPLNVRSVLIPCSRAPPKRQKRFVCSILLLCFCGCAVITPDWTSAWFLHLAKLPILSQRLPIPTLKSFTEVRMGPFPQSADNSWMSHTWQQTTRLVRVDSELLMAEASPDLQTGFADDDSDVFFTKVLENKRQST